MVVGGRVRYVSSWNTLGSDVSYALDFLVIKTVSLEASFQSLFPASKDIV